jgi:hypothetical protein
MYGARCAVHAHRFLSLTLEASMYNVAQSNLELGVWRCASYVKCPLRHFVRSYTLSLSALYFIIPHHLKAYQTAWITVYTGELMTILHFNSKFNNIIIIIIIIIIISVVLFFVAIIVSSRTGWFRDPIFLTKVGTVEDRSDFGTPHSHCLSEGTMNFLEIFSDRGFPATKVTYAAKSKPISSYRLRCCANLCT